MEGPTRVGMVKVQLGLKSDGSLGKSRLAVGRARLIGCLVSESVVCFASEGSLGSLRLS